MTEANMNLTTLYQKYKDILFYGIFGVLTTLVNLVVYFICAHPMHLGTMPSTIIAWIAAVLFAYITNRKWVFHSSASSPNEIIREIISFFACRLTTGIVDWLCMFLFVDVFHFNDVIVKAAANVLVIILNYVASKLIIFRHTTT